MAVNGVGVGLQPVCFVGDTQVLKKDLSGSAGVDAPL